MRGIISGLVLVVVSIATAAAQSYPPANAAPTQAAPTQTAAAPAAPAPAAPAPTAATPPAPALPAAPLYPSGSANFHVNGADVIRAAPPLTPEQQKAQEASRTAWEARCRPTAEEDREGIRRTHYAAPDCDLSAFNTAGAK